MHKKSPAGRIRDWLIANLSCRAREARYQFPIPASTGKLQVAGAPPHGDQPANHQQGKTEDTEHARLWNTGGRGGVEIGIVHVSIEASIVTDDGARGDDIGMGDAEGGVAGKAAV